MTKLCTELAHHPKIKVVDLIKYYNFAKGCTAMQTLYDIVQLRSNIQLENNDLHYRYDLETKLALVMNTKVVPCDILNMFKVPLRPHKHFIHWSHVNPSICEAFSDNTCNISNHRDKIGDAHAHE